MKILNLVDLEKLNVKYELVYKDNITNNNTKKYLNGVLQIYQNDQGCSNPIGNYLIKE